MGIRTRIAAVAATSALVLAATLAAPVPPARATVPTAITITGDAGDPHLGDSYHLNLTVRPWILFGTPIGFAGVSGKILSSGWHLSGEAFCLFGLAWQVSASTTTPHTASFTCLWVYTNHFLTTSFPSFNVAAITLVDGPGGSMDWIGDLPKPSWGSNPITVTYS